MANRRQPNLTREERVVAGMDRNGSQKAITLSSGVVLRAKRVPILILSEVLKTFKRPEVPIVFIEDLGREEPNPADPEYINAVEDWNNERNLAMVDLFFVAGTEIVEIPRNVTKVEDDSWTETLEAIGITPPKNKKLRYLLWLKNVAAIENADVEKIMEAVGRESGASEHDVTEALNEFRDTK